MYGDDQIDALDSDISDKVDCGPGTDSKLADFTRSFTRGSFGAWVYESVVNCETVTWTRIQPLADPVERGISVPGHTLAHDYKS